jgi:lipoate-protein ligase A
LQNVPIFEQLQIEEALLRTDERSFCILNFGSPRAIVMGISGEPNQLLDIPKVREQNVLVIKRFSGGGTVVVDDDTLFVTFIISKKDLAIPGYPEPILNWSADLYRQAWQIPDFHLRENDYCIGNRKCGGNAQYMRKERWIHHTSFLWDYQIENMKLLLLPPKRPAYRADRSHDDFLCRLSSCGSSMKERIEQLKNELVKRFYIRPFALSSLEKKEHRQATTLIRLDS